MKAYIHFGRGTKGPFLTTSVDVKECLPMPKSRYNQNLQPTKYKVKTDYGWRRVWSMIKAEGCTPCIKLNGQYESVQITE